VLVQRKADEAWDISKESNDVSDVGDYLTEMNIHVILYSYFKSLKLLHFYGFSC
jgi:hypothetical protein